MAEEIEKLGWDIYNAQGHNGGDVQEMIKALEPCTLPEDVKEHLAEWLGSRGFISQIYVVKCLEHAFEHVGGIVREHKDDKSPPKDYPKWGRWAQYVKGAKIVPEEDF